MEPSEMSELETYNPKSCKRPVLVVLVCQPGNMAASRPASCMKARGCFVQKGVALGDIVTFTAWQSPSEVVTAHES